MNTSAFFRTSEPLARTLNGNGDPFVHQLSLFQMHQPPRRCGGLRVVGHHHHCLAGLLVQPAEEGQGGGGGIRIEVPGRLVGHQDGRVGDDRPGDRHPLLLATGQLAGVVVVSIEEADRVEHHLHPSPPFAPAEGQQEKRKLDVLERGEHGDQVVELEDVIQAARQPASRVRDSCESPPTRTDPAVGRSPAIGFKRVVFPDPDGPMRARNSDLDGEVQVAEDGDRLHGVGLRQAFDLDQRIRQSQGSGFVGSGLSARGL